MKPAIKTAVITILITQFIVILLIAANGWEDSLTVFGFYNIILSVPELVIAAVFILKRKRDEGFGIAIACGIMLLVGFGACTMAPGIFTNSI